MANTEKEPAASLTDPIIGSIRLGGGGMFMGGGPSIAMPLIASGIAQSNYQTKIGNPMFASASVNDPTALAKLGRNLIAGGERVGNHIGGQLLDTVAGGPERMARNMMYGKFPDPRPSTTPFSLYRDFKAIQAGGAGIASGLGATTVGGVASKIALSAARGGVFGMVMPVLDLGAGSDREPQWRIDARREREANDKMITTGVSDFRKEALAAGKNPDMAWLTELPQDPLWKTDQTPAYTAEEKALGSYEKVLEGRAKQIRETERLAKLPTFNAVEDRNSFMSAHFLRQ